MNTISRGFHGRRPSEVKLPPGQYLEHGFPVLQAGPTPSVRTATWAFTLTTETGDTRRWDWKQFTALPPVDITVDIHCVTQWSKLATNWRGVSLDTLLDGVTTDAGYAMARSYGGYTTTHLRPRRPPRPDRRLVHLVAGVRPPPAAAGRRLGHRPPDVHDPRPWRGGKPGPRRADLLGPLARRCHLRQQEVLAA